MPFPSPSYAETYLKERVVHDVKSFGIDPANPKNLKEQAIAIIGVDLYKAFIEGYTRK